MEKPKDDERREPEPADERIPDCTYSYDPVAAAAGLPPEPPTPPPPPCPACGGLAWVALLTSWVPCRACHGTGTTAPPAELPLKAMIFDAQDRVVLEVYAREPEPKSRGAES